MNDAEKLKKVVLDYIKAESSVTNEKEEIIYSFLNDYAFLLGAFTSLTFALRFHLTIDELKSHVSNLTLRGYTIAEYIPKSSNVLDVGCGLGYLGKILVEKGCRYIGIDSEEKRVTVANEIYRSSGIQDRAKALVFDILKAKKLPFENNSFDYVVFIWSIHDMEKSIQRAYLEESKRVLNIGGHLLIYERQQIINDETLRKFITDIGFVHEKKIVQGVVITHGRKTKAVLDIYKKVQ